jgi:uncharacterized membrane protein
LARVLIAGESWTTTSIHVKGFDSFTTVAYEEGVGALRDALLESGHDVTFMPNHIAAVEFPHTVDALRAWDVVLLSDIGSNTLLIPPATFARFESKPNRLVALREWVRGGGGFGMIGGYLSFQGIEAKANYRGTAVAELLPVELESGDDRVESPDDGEPALTGEPHPIVEGLHERWPAILGYQRAAARPSGSVLARVGSDPLLVAGEFGDGRTLAYMTDIGPHWAPPAFLAWEGYARLWDQAVRWLAG